MTNNILLQTDSYKLSHYKQYPEGTTRLHSYLCAREDRVNQVKYTSLFGLNSMLARIAQGFTLEDVEELEEIGKAHFGTDEIVCGDWREMFEAHGGKFPVNIWAIPQGQLVERGTPMICIENTDTRYPWVVNYLETLLVQLWYPSTILTRSLYQRAMINEALSNSGSSIEAGGFMLHDFGVRGVSCMEQAALGGAAHLMAFDGTDNLPALAYLRDFYDCPMAGFSVPAAEHSTITSWGKSGEIDAYRNMLEQYPTGIVSIVADSYDIHKAVEEMFCGDLSSLIESRDGRVVIRPDSGDMIDTNLAIVEALWSRFGGEVREEGHKVLNDKVRILQGDGINPAMLQEFLDVMESEGWAAENWVFGSGGGLLQQVNRDTFRHAFKASMVEVNGEWREVFKEAPDKKSMSGRFHMVNKYKNILRLAMENGKVACDMEKADTIRTRVQRSIDYALGVIADGGFAEDLG